MSDVTVSTAGMRVVRLLAGQPPRTISELIHETGVTRTAVTEQLNELVTAGYVERTVEKLPGRGRPRHLFSATKAALVLLFASNQQLIVPAIWKAIDETGGEALMQKILRSVNRNLAAHYRAKITASDPKKRLEQFAAILEQEGGLVDLVARDGQITISKRTCAFISMIDDSRHVCELDFELISAIAGCPVRLVSCRHDGAPCCQFEIDTKAADSKHVQNAGIPKRATVHKA